MSTARPRAATAASGATPAYLYWGPTVGNPYGPSFEGNLRNIDIFESAEAAGGNYSHSGGAGGSPAPAYDLVVSGARSRAGAVDLQGATLSEDAFVFVTGTKDARKVTFWLDDNHAVGTPERVETKYWHDFAGTAPDGGAYAWDTTSVSEGRHTITAEIIEADRSRVLLNHSFIIDNII